MTSIHRFFLTLPLLFLTFILFPSERVGANFRPPSARQSASDVLAEINTLRTARNLSPYQVNPILMNIAQTQAEYMAGAGVVSHFDGSGARPFQRAIAAGYPVAGDLSIGGLFSENIHYGPNLTPSQLIDLWQADSDNMQAMISPQLQDVGVGIAVANGQTYYVMDAGSSIEETVITETPGSTLLITSTPGTQPSPTLGSTPTLKPLATATFGIPTSTATILAAPTITGTPTPMPVPPGSLQAGIRTVGMIIVIALVAAGVGSWVGRQK